MGGDVLLPTDDIPGLLAAPAAAAPAAPEAAWGFLRIRCSFTSYTLRHRNTVSGVASGAGRRRRRRYGAAHGSDVDGSGSRSGGSGTYRARSRG